jgi:hypothetical protein
MFFGTQILMFFGTQILMILRNMLLPSSPEKKQEVAAAGSPVRYPSIK